MAAKENRSKKIREYIEKHPDAGPTEIAEKLGAGYSVSLVSNVKHRLANGDDGSKPRGRKTSKKKSSKSAATAVKTPRARKSSNGAVTLADAQRANELAKEFGGVDKLREVLDAVESFSS